MKMRTRMGMVVVVVVVVMVVAAVTTVAATDGADGGELSSRVAAQDGNGYGDDGNGYGYNGDDELSVGYYDESCPQAEDVVRTVVEGALRDDPSLAAGLLRMHFHDCFVRGCDASNLLDSRSEDDLAEKDAFPNRISFRGANIIDVIKDHLEEACPEIVSCADILAFAARDAVYIAGGPSWPVPSGRMDGMVSQASEVITNLPAPNFNMQQLTHAFKNKGLSKHDMVVLSGAHTIGSAHCIMFRDRLYNFGGTGMIDPSLSPSLASSLKAACPPRVRQDSPTVVPMEAHTPNVFDNRYFMDLKQGRGLFTSDTALMQDPTTSTLVQKNSKNQTLWFQSFADAMVRLSQIEVKTTSSGEGEIRKNCHVPN